MKRVTVVIVNWNGKDNTLSCLASLGKRNIIVVDNASTDGSVEAINTRFPAVEIIQNSENLGFTGGNNIGIKSALSRGADFIWLLNNDTVVDKNALQSLIEAFDDRSVGIAGSKIYFSHGREFHKDRYKIGELGNVLWYAGGRIDWNNMYASHRGVDEVDRGQYDEPEETEFITGCSMMVKREVFEKVGLLDEKFFAYLEDVDFCLRAKNHGYKLLYKPSSIVWHKNASSSGSPGSVLHEYYLTRNRLAMAFRYAPIRTRLAIVRESLRLLVSGTAIQRKAIRHAFTYRFGKQMI